ncbi:MAG: patatin-like phospholipase family protein [Planctomycetota bacterium]
MALLAAACSAPARENPLPADLVEEAAIPGLPDARAWGDVPPDQIYRWFDEVTDEDLSKLTAVYGHEHTYLSISGGGADGAFGAGLLCGWTESGTRPEFTLVSGISTGALIAPFAFLGPDYDDALEEIYTSYSTDDLARSKSPIAVLLGDSALNSAPMREKIAQYYDQDMLDRIAEESRRGRSLLIGTTNLDAERPVIWNIGRIARSDAPNRLQIFQDVLLASAAIPGVFEPVLFEVEANGERYDELHVDGGATTQLFLYPIGLDWTRVLELLEVPRSPTVYVIRNSSLEATYQPVDRSTLAIAATTVLSLMRSSGFGDLYRLYLAAERDGMEFKLASIPDSFDVESNEPFDTAYMGALFELGHALALEGYRWSDAPPGVENAK